MKLKFIFILIFAFSVVSFSQITRDFATVESLRMSNHGPKKGEKIFVKDIQNMYAVDFVDNISTDDGYNTIIQGNIRWKCVSCKVPVFFITQDDVNPLDKQNPTLAEIKNYVTLFKTPNKNGVFLHYYRKNDTIDINNIYPYFELDYDSSRVVSVKINGVEKLSGPIWLYQGTGNWVYVDNTLTTLYENNKPLGVNYTVNDDLLQGDYSIDITNITGGIFNTEVTTEYWDGDSWESYGQMHQATYLVDLGSGSKDEPLFSYLVQNEATTIIRKPEVITDLTMGKNTLVGPRSLTFSSTAGNSSIIQSTTNELSIKNNYHFKSNGFHIGENPQSSVIGLGIKNGPTINSIIQVEHNGTNRAVINAVRSRGSSSNKQSVTLNDKLGSFAFAGWDGQSYQSAALLEAFVDGTVTAGAEGVGQVPQRFSIVTGYNLNNRAERIVIKSDGKVGIGSTTPSQLLSVNGKISIGDDVINPTNGTIRYNSSIHKFQGFANGIWVDLH